MSCKYFLNRFNQHYNKEKLVTLSQGNRSRVRVSIFYFPYTGHTISTLTRAGSEENQTHLRFLPGKDNLHEDECQGGTSTGQEEQCSTAEASGLGRSAQPEEEEVGAGGQGGRRAIHVEAGK